MRMCITGYVGDPSFEEVLRTIMEGSRRLTLFVHDGSTEKVLHFSRSEVWALVPPSVLGSLPADHPLQVILQAQRGAHGSNPNGASECAPATRESPAGPDVPHESAAPVQGTGDAGYIEAATRYLTGEMSDIVCWTGGLFEACDGALPQSLSTGGQFVRICCAPATIFRSWDPLKALEATPDSDKGCYLPTDPLARVQTLCAALDGASFKHLIHRELARQWQRLGLPSRAAHCLREVAHHYLEWGSEEGALELLEGALEVCPLDLNTAEDALLLYQAQGRQQEAETVAERVFSHLEKLKQHDAITRFYRLIHRTPENPFLRRLGGESMVRAGETAAGLEELFAAARILESRRDPKGAEKIYRQVMEIDPTSQEAQRSLLRIKRLERIKRRLIRWGTLSAALIIAVAWLSWDGAAAFAYKRVEHSQPKKAVREALEVLRQEASNYPLSRYAVRLTRLEAKIHQQAFEEDLGLLVQASEAQAAGDLDKAHHLFGEVLQRTLIPQFSERAKKAREEITLARGQSDSLLRKARDYVSQQNLEAAFGVYREILQGSRREIVASAYSVPVYVDTVPSGATIEVGLETVGKTPKWVFLPADPENFLRLSLAGFQKAELHDPLGPLLEANRCHLRVALTTRTLWRMYTGGGLFARNLDPDAAIIPILGVDGVLRGIDASDYRTRWETPFEPTLFPPKAPEVAGPAILACPGQGNLFAFSLASGKLAWSTFLAERGAPVHVGPMFAGQALVVAAGRPLLLNPLTGLLVRRIQLGQESASGIMAVSGSTGLFALDGGGIAAANLRTGALEFVRWKEHNSLKGMVPRGSCVVVLSTDGQLSALSLEQEAPLWKSILGPDYTLICGVSSNLVCVGSESGKIVCLDAATGIVKWKSTREGKPVVLLSPKGTGASFFVELKRSGKTAIMEISGADGSVLREIETDSEEAAALHVTDHSLLVSTPGEGAVAFERSRG